MPVNNSPNMLLPIPAVGLEPGPEWATDINNSLTIVDQHSHAPGSGVQINPSGILINTDLAFNINSATALLSAQFTPQAAAIAPLTAVYVIGRELYYNDGAGNSVQLTSNGSIAGATGSISGLVPPASASYSGSTFVWQSNTLTAANMDAGSYILRNISASSKGLTLNPPAAMGADYSLVLPSLPGSTSFMTLDASGNMAGSISTSGGIVGSNIAALTITASNIANTTITAAKIANATITTTQVASSTLLLTNLATSARESVYANGIGNILPNGSSQILVAPVVRNNTSGSYNSSNGSYTVPQNGYLDMSMAINYTPGLSNSYIVITLVLNNVEQARQTTNAQVSAGQDAGAGLSVVGLEVSAGDIIQVEAVIHGVSVTATSGHLSFTLR